MSTHTTYSTWSHREEASRENCVANTNTSTPQTLSIHLYSYKLWERDALCCHGDGSPPPLTTGYVCPLQLQCVGASSDQLHSCGGGGNLRLKVPQVIAAHLGWAEQR